MLKSNLNSWDQSAPLITVSKILNATRLLPSDLITFQLRPFNVTCVRHHSSSSDHPGWATFYTTVDFNPHCNTEYINLALMQVARPVTCSKFQMLFWWHIVLLFWDCSFEFKSSLFIFSVLLLNNNKKKYLKWAQSNPKKVTKSSQSWFHSHRCRRGVGQVASNVCIVLNQMCHFLWLKLWLHMLLIWLMFYVMRGNSPRQEKVKLLRRQRPAAYHLLVKWAEIH